MLTFCALTFFGCSTESSEDFENESQTSDIFQTPTIQVIDFKLVGEGEYQTSDTKSCNTKGEFVNRGVSSTGEFGELSAQFSICTDFEGYNYFTGSYTTADGDQFWFTSDQSGIDENGKYYMFNIAGGTGIFINATGEIKVYRTERESSDNNGTFTDFGKGLISY